MAAAKTTTPVASKASQISQAKSGVNSYGQKIGGAVTNTPSSSVATKTQTATQGTPDPNDAASITKRYQDFTAKTSAPAGTDTSGLKRNQFGEVIGGAVTNDGIQYPSSNPSTPSRYSDSSGNLSDAEKATMDFTPAKSYEDIYASRRRAADDTIAAIEQKYQADVAATAETNTADLERTKAIAAMSGLQGSGSALGMVSTTEQAGKTRLAQDNATRLNAISDVLTKVEDASRAEATAEQQRAPQDAARAVAAQKQLRDDTMTQLANLGVDLDSWKSSHPDTYAYTLNKLYNGNENAMKADFVAKGKGSIINMDKPITSGNSLIYLQKKPDGSIVPVKVDAGVNVEGSTRYQHAVAGGQLYTIDTATGKATAVGGGSNDQTQDQAPVPGQGGILNATGLSLNEFNYLTQGTSALTRMSAPERSAIISKANAFLNKKGIDVSTFQSQYKAYNDVLQNNLKRANQTTVMAGEVTGSADSLASAIDEKDLGKFKTANVLDLMLGKEVNDKTTMKYSSQLRFMANDLAGYLAASRGASSPELQDQRDAAQLISDGLNKESVTAFKDSILANEKKVNKVVSNAANNAQKQVWDMFGVGGQYKAPSKSSNVQDTFENAGIDYVSLKNDNPSMSDDELIQEAINQGIIQQ